MTNQEFRDALNDPKHAKQTTLDAQRVVELAHAKARGRITEMESTHWACACIRHDKTGPGFKIKLNPNSARQCQKCGATQTGAKNVRE